MHHAVLPAKRGRGRDAGLDRWFGGGMTTGEIVSFIAAESGCGDFSICGPMDCHLVCAFEVRYDLPIVFVPSPEDGARRIERWAFYFAREAVLAVFGTKTHDGHGS